MAGNKNRIDVQSDEDIPHVEVKVSLPDPTAQGRMRFNLLFLVALACGGLAGCGGKTLLQPNVMPAPISKKDETSLCVSRNVEICKPNPFWNESKSFFENVDNSLRAFSGNIPGVLIENHKRTVLELLETDEFMRSYRRQDVNFNARYNAFRAEFENKIFPHLSVWDRALNFVQGEISERPHPLKVFIERLSAPPDPIPLEKLEKEPHKILELYVMKICLGRAPTRMDIEGDSKRGIPAVMDYSTRLLLEEITRRLMDLFPQAYPSSRVDTILKALTPLGSDSFRVVTEYKASIQQNFDYFDASVQRIIAANPQVDIRYKDVRKNAHAVSALQESNRQFLLRLESSVAELKTLLEDVEFLKRLEYASEQDIKESKDPYIQRIFDTINAILFTIHNAKSVELTPSQKRLLEYSVKTMVMEAMTWNDRLRRSLLSVFTGGLLLVR